MPFFPLLPSISINVLQNCSPNNVLENAAGPIVLATQMFALTIEQDFQLKAQSLSWESVVHSAAHLGKWRLPFLGMHWVKSNEE